ncbi:MAG: CPBP family glutamic-type intramembrane protease [Candidatus Omnitrophota bacterium]
MRFGVGFAFPLYYVLIIRKLSLSEFGITRKKWFISLIAGIVFALLLLFQFISEDGKRGQEILLDLEAGGPVFYIMVAGIFEVIFFYGFLRQQFENAFGIIPGTILMALFYSFHHVGFQPEFVKLFFVGVMYASVFRITRNALIIYPFFWGVGACWDVLVRFGAMEALEEWAWIKGAIVLTLMIIFMGYLRGRRRVSNKGKSL